MDVQDSALAALTKFVEEEEARQGIVRIPAPRDYVPCDWCNGDASLYGKACMACFSKREAKKKELDEEYKRQFPDGPKPFFQADLNDPEQLEQAKRVLHADVITKAFSEGGGGVQEIMDLAAVEMAKRSEGKP